MPKPNVDVDELIRETFFLMVDRGWCAMQNRDTAYIQKEIDYNTEKMRKLLHLAPGVDLEEKIRNYCLGVIERAL
jgi:hypothetical protein